MKKVRIITALISVIMLSVCFASCDSGKITNEDETGTVHFESDDEAYEAMTGAALEGNFNDALRYYKSGGANADNSDVSDWYFYSMAVNDYNKKGCIGYSLDLLQNHVSMDFEQSDKIMGELQSAVRDYNGVYFNGDYYIYLSDGKIAVGEFVQLTDRTVTNGEIAVKDNVLYWAEHNVNGNDKLLYSIEITEKGLTLTAVEGAENAMYAGDYTPFAGEMPVLVY